jgi:hypothetical protein
MAHMVVTIDQLRVGLALVVLLSGTGGAQARVLSAPPEPSLLNLTGAWARASSLGDLQELKATADYVELRVWGGFGSGATQGVVLRRASGKWSAFLARVRRCELEIPLSVGDTASRATMQGFVAQARRQCGTPLSAVGAGVRIITADTLAVAQLSAADSSIENAWTAAVRAGVSQLPGSVKRTGATSTDFTYVVELRRGSEYRASQIEHLDRPETEADRQVKELYAAISSVLPPELRLQP